MSSTLADLLSHNDKDAVRRAFHAHDLGEDGPSNTEARIWVATLAVAARAVPEVTDASNDSLDSVNVQQCDDDSAQYQLPTVSASQSAVANEIILRILLSKGENTVGAETFQKVLAIVHACIHTSHAIIMYVAVTAAAASDACVNGQCFKAVASYNACVLMCLQAS